MRGISWAILAGLMWAGSALAQNAPGSKSEDKAAEKKVATLEELLTKALQNSPDVQVAEARLREAEASLRQTRLLVAQKLVDLHNTADAQQKTLSAAESDFKRLTTLRQQGSVPGNEVDAAEVKLASLKNQIAQIESSLNVLIGRLPGGGADSHGVAVPAMGFGGGMGGGGGMPDPGPKPRMPRRDHAEKLAAVLDRPLKKSDKSDKPLEDASLAEVIGQFRMLAPGVPLLANMPDRDQLHVRIDFRGELTVGTFFEILSDCVPGLKVFVRDYGFLITFEGNEPTDGMPLTDFWQQNMKKPGG